jgi:hypothetical protein
VKGEGDGEGGGGREERVKSVSAHSHKAREAEKLFDTRSRRNYSGPTAGGQFHMPNFKCSTIYEVLRPENAILRSITQ